MEDKDKEQLQQALEAASESIAEPAAADSDPAPDGAADSGQPPARKWANLFDSPEKLEEAYGHIYRAFHAKSRELQDTRQALENLAQALSQQAAPGQGAPFAPPAWTEGAQSGVSPAILQAVEAAREAAQQARDLGERFLLSSVESQINSFFKDRPELGATEQDFEAFADEAAQCLGDLDADALQRLPQALERAYRIVTYPEAVREARMKQEQEEREAGRFEVESAGPGAMSMPRNQARETSFRRLVQRLKSESAL